MSYKTELMEQILRSEEAQKIITYVSPYEYGESYVMLWLFQAIGTALDEGKTITDSYRREVTPATAQWTINLWEDEYGIPHDSSMTILQRQNQLIERITSNSAIHPKRLEDIISNATGFKTEITENISKNTFEIKIRGYIKDLSKLVKKIDEKKPAHLIYKIIMAELISQELTTYWGVVPTIHKKYIVEVFE